MPSAAICYQRRARLYDQLDARLRTQTRFFGAACITNRVLSHLASVGGALARADACAHWLADLGASLEAVNCAIAADVFAGRLSGPALDERIVSIEQSAVEQTLRVAVGEPQGPHAERLAALDALLNRRGWLSALHFNPAVRWYQKVIHGVRRELRSPIEFAQQPHREKIGMALIGALRRDSVG